MAIRSGVPRSPTPHSQVRMLWQIGAVLWQHITPSTNLSISTRRSWYRFGAIALWIKCGDRIPSVRSAANWARAFRCVMPMKMGIHPKPVGLAWTQAQAQRLRTQEWERVDLPNLIEELEFLGKQQRQELHNRLSVSLSHLLEWEYQPQRRSRSWLATLRIQCRDTPHLLNKNPSLKPYLKEALEATYKTTRDLAMAETNLPDTTFPPLCPYSLATILNPTFYPSEPSQLISTLQARIKS